MNDGKRIMVTGAGGYLGSVLLPVLLKAGHHVVAVDKFYFGDHPLNRVSGAPGLEIRRCDVRDISAADLVGVDTVISLAAISNDPAGDLAPNWTVEVNQDATIRLAELAADEGVSRFVFASSCSVYGAGGDNVLDESAEQRPLTVYASTKQATENALNELATEKFRVISLRMATLFGVSPRMRLDLVVNRMVSHAVSGKPIQVHGGGQWRPLLHVRDAAAAYVRCVDLPLEDIPLGDAFNVVGENVTVGDLAERVSERLGGVPLDIREDGLDRRSYRVSQDKFAGLTGFRPVMTVERGVDELYRALSAEVVATDDPRYSTVASLKAVVAKPAREGGEQVRRTFLPFALPLIGREEEQEVLDTLRSGWLTTGPKTKRFEALCAEYLGVRHAIAMNSCTGALHVGLAALGIGPGDEAEFADLAALRPLARRGFGTHSHHLYVVRLDLDALTVTRDEFMVALREEGIGTGVHFRSMHLQPYYRDALGMTPDALPVAADVSERIISLPLYPKMTGQDVEDVVRAVRKVALAYTRTA
ncbi:DegT/DnrJ/EryC1/StrS family aminotransferase [Saccharothrix deserti]|uniref:DegT/DnrJ/EryC1/StrS family aminotransferase n=1 Tax=Saccharothrix deserti TaxID=2593674 RepID=UPI00131AAD4A|nr:DegT/DnrJ/EryC1/StrS family aminotransferase [Saccharothrix deserti]